MTEPDAVLTDKDWKLRELEYPCPKCGLIVKTFYRFCNDAGGTTWEGCADCFSRIEQDLADLRAENERLWADNERLSRLAEPPEGGEKA